MDEVESETGTSRNEYYDELPFASDDDISNDE